MDGLGVRSSGMCPASTPAAPLRILLVEDHADTREMYAMFLDFEGMAVSGAGRGAEALERIAAQCPDLIVTDLHLPDMSGLELTRQIKQNPATAHIAIVLLTGETFGDIDAQARAAGCTMVCLKPCPPDVLAELITQVLATKGRDADAG